MLNKQFTNYSNAIDIVVQVQKLMKQTLFYIYCMSHPGFISNFFNTLLRSITYSTLHFITCVIILRGNTYTPLIPLKFMLRVIMSNT